MSTQPVVDDLIDRWQSAWSGRQGSAFHALCAPDVHYEDPACREPLEGADEIAAHAALLWRMFPDARLERTGERLTDGRFVAAPVQGPGHASRLARRPARDRPLPRRCRSSSTASSTATAARLWRVRAFFDAYDAAIQLGVLPARGTISERAMLMLRGFGLRSRT